MLFHEASCLALLEAVLFHRDAVEAVQEAGPDLTDYCVRYMKNPLVVQYKMASEENQRSTSCGNNKMLKISANKSSGNLIKMYKHNLFHMLVCWSQYSILYTVLCL